MVNVLRLFAVQRQLARQRPRQLKLARPHEAVDAQHFPLVDRERHVLQRAHEIAAEAWQADFCRFVTGGSTQSLQIALAAVARPGDTVVVASNCHKAEWASAIYAGLDLVPVRVEADRGWNEGAARKQLLQFFEAWGFADPASASGRRKLSGLLFR